MKNNGSKRRGGKLRVARAVAANRLYGKYGGYTAVRAAQTIQAAVRRELAKKVETKRSCYSVTDGQEIYHNNFIKLDDNILQTSQGATDPVNSTQNNRIGDQIVIKGVGIKLMVELNERYSDVTFRLMVVKCAKGDDPTRATLFNGLSANKIMDSINTERYTIIASKYFKIKAPNQSVTSTSGTTSEVSTLAQNAGIEYPNQADWRATLSRATKIVNLWIPGNRITKNSILQYENGTGQPKFFDYKVVLYAYSNYTTLQDIWYVGRVNEYMVQMYYKDP